MAEAAGSPFVAVGTTTTADVFRAAGIDRVWPGVGAWVDDLLGAKPATSRRRPRRATGSTS